MADYRRMTCFSLPLERPVAFLAMALAFAHDRSCGLFFPESHPCERMEPGDIAELARVLGVAEKPKAIHDHLKRMAAAISEGKDDEEEPTGVHLSFRQDHIFLEPSFRVGPVLRGEGEQAPNIGLLVPFIQAALVRYEIPGVFDIRWSDSCSSMRTGAFSGGGVVFTREEARWFDIGDLVADALIEMVPQAHSGIPGPSPGM